MSGAAGGPSPRSPGGALWGFALLQFELVPLGSGPEPWGSGSWRALCAGAAPLGSVPWGAGGWGYVLGWHRGPRCLVQLAYPGRRDLAAQWLGHRGSCGCWRAGAFGPGACC